MQYRRFGKLDWKSSVLGFGIMRLPLTDDDPANIDETESVRMIRYAIDHGVNYVDTAYLYHSGQSEPLLGHALLDGYREKVKLATKMSPWLIESSRDFDRYLNEPRVGGVHTIPRSDTRGVARRASLPRRLSGGPGLVQVRSDPGTDRPL